MRTCEFCGGQMKPLVVSWFCPKDCDIKAQMTVQTKQKAPMGNAWERVQYKMPKHQAHFLTGRAGRVVSKGQLWHVCLWADGMTWDVLDRLTLSQVFDAHTVIDVNPILGTIVLRKSRMGYKSFNELPDQWAPNSPGADRVVHSDGGNMGMIDRKVLFEGISNDDEEYEVTVVSFSPPSASTWHEPGDSGEVDLSPVVDRLVNGRKTEEITMDDFIGMIAEDRWLTRIQAEDLINERAFMVVLEQMGDEYEDARESELERDD